MYFVNFLFYFFINFKIIISKFYNYFRIYKTIPENNTKEFIFSNKYII